MAGGYDAPVAERGQNLSGGQKQRIALARVFLKNPPILILDEGTSALDNISERLVQRAITAARADRTVILVAHRLSTLREADRILVFDDGKIVETGTYTELVRQGGVFAELVRSAEEIDAGSDQRPRCRQTARRRLRWADRPSTAGKARWSPRRRSLEKKSTEGDPLSIPRHPRMADCDVALYCWFKVAYWSVVRRCRVSLVYFLLIGLAAGWLAGHLVRGHGFGLVENLIIGVIGALIGGFVFSTLGVNIGGLLGELIAATVGALILLYLLRLIRRA